jgi:hypothetical protein
LANQDNKAYLGKISKMKELQINDEKMTTANLKKLLNLPDAQQHVNCQKWSNRFNKAYDEWKDLPQQEKENDKWKKEILQIIKIDR